jgi:hypothetical protein
MMKRDITRRRNLLKLKKIAKGLRINMKRIIIALVFLSFIIPMSKPALADKEIKPGKKQAVLILADGRQIVLGASSDTIVNSKSAGVHIVIDSTGINYITADSTIKVKQDTCKIMKCVPAKIKPAKKK